MLKIEDLDNKCADVNYLRGSAAPFSRTLVGNYYVEHTMESGYSVVEVLNAQVAKKYGREVVHRIATTMTKYECYYFLMGLEYSLINLPQRE